MSTIILALWLSLAGEAAILPEEDPLQVSEEMKQFLDSKISRSGDSMSSRSFGRTHLAFPTNLTPGPPPRPSASGAATAFRSRSCS